MPAPGLSFRLPTILSSVSRLPSYTLIWQHQHVSQQRCRTLQFVPPQTHSTALKPPDPVPVRRGSGPPIPVCHFDPAAQSPSSRQQTLCQWLDALRGGTTSRLPELDALSNCCLCTIALNFLLSASGWTCTGGVAIHAVMVQELDPLPISKLTW